MKSFSQQVFWFCSAILLLVVLAFPRYTRPGTEATLAWDVSGYYLYLPAIFIYGDLERVSFLPQIIEKYQPSYSPDQAFPIENGNQVMKYSVGMAVLYAPFFAVGHAVAKLTGYPADGFSLPYQVAIHLGSVLAAILGLFFLSKSLLRYFPDRTVGWTLLLIALGTNFFNYATFDAANAHGWLFGIVALLTYLSIRYHEAPSTRLAIGLGTCIGLAALVRPTEVLYVIIPLLWGVGSVAALRERLFFFKKNWLHLLLAGFAMGAVGFLQLAYWKHVSGHWLVYSYGDQGFSFLRPHVMDVFFSYRKGWLVYTPLMAFALLGFLPLTPKGEPNPIRPRNSETDEVSGRLPKMGSPLGVRGQSAILVLFLLNTWVVCAWDIWWYGGAFGQRAMVQSYPLLAFPLAAFLVWAKGNTFLKSVTFALISGCVALNLFQTYQAHWGPWEADAMTGPYYHRIFAKLKDDPWDKLLLDAQDGFFGKKLNQKTVYATDFEAVKDSVDIGRELARSGSLAVFAAPQTPYSHTLNLPRPPEMAQGKWVHASAHFYCKEKVWEAWEMPQFVVSFELAGKPVKSRALRPMRVLSPGNWLEVGMDFKVPRRDFDQLKIYLWCPAGKGELWMDDLRLEVFEE